MLKILTPPPPHLASWGPAGQVRFTKMQSQNDENPHSVLWPGASSNKWKWHWVFDIKTYIKLSHFHGLRSAFSWASPAQECCFPKCIVAIKMSHFLSHFRPHPGTDFCKFIFIYWNLLLAKGPSIDHVHNILCMFQYVMYVCCNMLKINVLVHLSPMKVDKIYQTARIPLAIRFIKFIKFTPLKLNEFNEFHGLGGGVHKLNRIQ